MSPKLHFFKGRVQVWKKLNVSSNLQVKFREFPSKKEIRKNRELGIWKWEVARHHVNLFDLCFCNLLSTAVTLLVFITLISLVKLPVCLRALVLGLVGWARSAELSKESSSETYTNCCGHRRECLVYWGSFEIFDSGIWGEFGCS